MSSHLIVQKEKTPLMYAAQYTKYPAVVEFLRKAEADVNTRDNVSALEGIGAMHVEWLGG